MALSNRPRWRAAISRVVVAVAVAAIAACAERQQVETPPPDDLHRIGTCDDAFMSAMASHIRDIGVATSRHDVDMKILKILKDFEATSGWSYSNTGFCFFDFIEKNGVDVYYSGVVHFPVYVEVWLLPGEGDGHYGICVGANPLGWNSDTALDRFHPRGIPVPPGYGDDGPAAQARFLPVCRDDRGRESFL
jgi:hypothetical protein